MEKTEITYKEVLQQHERFNSSSGHIFLLRGKYMIFIDKHSVDTINKNVVFLGSCVIGPFSIIGQECEIRGKESDIQSVRIGHNVKIHGHCTIDSGSERPTVIGDDNYLMKFTHIGHDVQTGKSCTFSPGAKIGGHAALGDYVTVGMNACVHQNIYIPDGVMIGMNASMVKKEYEPYRKYVANGKDIGFNQIAYTKYGKETA